MNKKIPFILLILMLFILAVPAFAPQTAYAAGGVSAVEYNGLYCFSWSKGLSPGGCVALAGYYALYIPTSWLLYASATVFDSTMAFTLSTAPLNETFVVSTWSTVRDVANLAFIFILLYIAIGTILQIGGIELKKTLVNVIIIALLMNFSLFFTRVIIDASNVFANEFYTAIGSPSPTAHINPNMGVPERSISAGFVGAFNPQTMISPKMYKAWKKQDFNVSSMFIIFLFGAIVNVVAAYVFFYAGFLMVARVVMFLFLAISSPIAFIAYALPKGGSFASKWWGHLTDQALLAPVFLFFVYIIAEMIKPPSFIAGIFTSGGTFSDILIKMVLNFVVIIAALLIALRVAKKLSGEAGAMATKFAAAPVKLAATLATGGVAGVARHTIGRAASRVAESEKVKSFGRRHPGVGMALDTTLNKAGAGKFNKYQKDRTKRKTAYGKQITEETKIDKIRRGDMVLNQEETLRKQGLSDKQIRSMKLAKVTENRMKEKTERDQLEYASSVANPKFISKGVQILTGEKNVDRETSSNINETADKIFQRKDKKHNAEIDEDIKEYKADNNFKAKEKAVKEATAELELLNQSYARAEADGLSTSKIKAKIKTARAIVDSETDQLAPLQEKIKELNEQKKKIGKQEKSTKDLLKEALKEQKADDKTNDK